MMRNDRSDQSNQELVEALRVSIERAGRITFACFMQQALYHPEHGYYRSEAARPGRPGDFLTAPEADPIFGFTLARQIAQMAQLLGNPDPFTLREYGAGAGTLAGAFLEGLRIDHAPLLSKLRYEPIEINPARFAELTAELASAGFGERLAEPGEDPISGCILANEFLDALPVHRVEVRNGQPCERYVVWRDGWFAEEAGPLSTPQLEQALRTLADDGIELVEGQRAEINLGLPAWVATVSAQLSRGYVLVIDYGYRAEKLFGPSYREGTLRAYHRHTVSDDPFRAVGNQDLTAHVDFSALERAARQHGLQILGLTTQTDFLTGAGIGEILVGAQQWEGMTIQEYTGIRSAVIRMIDPGAMGRFRVLILGRDVPEEPRLLGLSTTL